MENSQNQGRSEENHLSWPPYSRIILGLVSLVFILVIIVILEIQPFDNGRGADETRAGEAVIEKREDVFSLYINNTEGFSFEYPTEYAPIQASTTKISVELRTVNGSQFFSYLDREQAEELSEHYREVSNREKSVESYEYLGSDTMSLDNDPIYTQARIMTGEMPDDAAYIPTGPSVSKVRYFEGVGNVGYGYFIDIATTTKGVFAFHEVNGLSEKYRYISDHLKNGKLIFLRDRRVDLLDRMAESLKEF